MELNLNAPVLDLNGKRVGDGTLGQLLASQLAGSAEGDAVKLYEWALKLHKNKPIEIDKSDFNMLKDFIEKSKVLSNLAKAQMLNYMFEADGKTNHVPKDKNLKPA